MSVPAMITPDGRWRVEVVVVRGTAGVVHGGVWYRLLRDGEVVGERLTIGTVLHRLKDAGVDVADLRDEVDQG